MNEVLVDANYLVALANLKDVNHQKAEQFATNGNYRSLVPIVAIPEAMYILKRFGGTRLASVLGDALVEQKPAFVTLTHNDFQRSMEIMQNYADADLDFVDSAITALAERLNITHVCTFDRRDFSIIRPNHVDYFTLLP